MLIAIGQWIMKTADINMTWTLEIQSKESILKTS